MSYPPYHLRPNKAIDRLAFVEAIRRLGSVGALNDYKYYGFGGPYLEDFRTLHEMCPELSQMFSIEKDAETHKQQQFHQPFQSLTLLHTTFESFLATFDPGDQKCIFWTDYTDLSPNRLEEFETLLSHLPEGSMVKISLKAEPKDYIRGNQDFGGTFSTYLGDPDAQPPPQLESFSAIVQEMVQVTSQRALPAGSGHVFQPVSSFCYADRSGMFSLTGVICAADSTDQTRGAFMSWELANLEWHPPIMIDFPILSIKERLHLQSQLPCDPSNAPSLRSRLGYRFTRDDQSTLSQLRQYCRFNRYSPMFMRVSL